MTDDSPHKPNDFPLCSERFFNLRRTKRRSAPNEKRHSARLMTDMDWKIKIWKFRMYPICIEIVTGHPERWKAFSGKVWRRERNEEYRVRRLSGFFEEEWHGEAQKCAEMRTNVQKCVLMCGNVHKCATSAVRLPNFAVKNEAHGTETHRKESGTSMGGENRE